MPSARKLITLALLACLMGTLTGCIFLRLNSFRKQMADFHKYGSLKIEDRHPVAYFNKPVLHISDISWLGGEEPSTTTGEKKGAYSATWQLIKLYPQERIPENENYDIDLTLDAKKKKVYRIRMPVRFREIISAEVMELFFDDADEADIAEKQSSAEWSMKNSQLLPTMKDIIKVCGQPYSYESTNSEISINYKYHLVAPVTQKNADPDSVDLDATLTYTNPGKGFLRSKVTMGKN